MEDVHRITPSLGGEALTSYFAIYDGLMILVY